MHEPAPVPGYASLRFSGEPFEVVGPSKPSFVRLARVGPDEVVLVYVESLPHPSVSSQRIGGAFSAWPPDVGEPIERQRGDVCNEVGEVVGFDDGSFALWTPLGWIHAAADSAGALCRLPNMAFPDVDPSGGVFAMLHDATSSRLVHRSKRAEQAHLVELGALPARMLFAVGTATPGRNLILAFPAKKKGATTVLVTAKGKLRKTTIPARGRLLAIPRPAGGAFLALSPGGATTVYAIGEDGAVVGEPWSYRNVSPYDGLVAFAPWRDGFVLATGRGGTGIGLVVSDGTNATYGEGTISGKIFMGGAVAASRDGSTILLAYVNHPRIEIARLTCGAGDGRPVFLPALEVRPLASPGPPAPPAPIPSRFGTRDDVVRRIQQRRIVAALFPLMEREFEGSSSGDAKAGHYEAHDGSGNSFVVHWNERGVVALGFDHDSPDSEYAKPVHARRPARHLRRVPASMRALANRAAEYGQRLATEGFWIAAGASPAHGESESLDVLKQLREDDTGEVWLAGAKEIGALAGRMAAGDPYEVTPDDGRALLALAAARRKPLEAERVERVAQELAKLGVVWRDAVAHAEETIDAQHRERAARLATPDRALLQAAHAGDLEAVKRALAAGANLEAKALAEELLWTPEGATPLIVALRQGHDAVGDHLIEAGADVDASYPAWGGPDCPLRIGAARGDVDLCRRLLAAPGSRDVTRVLGQMVLDTPRIAAIRAEAARRGADVGPSASEAVASDCAAIIRLLLDAGAAVPRAQSDTLATLAARGGAADLAARLGSVNVPDERWVVPVLPDPAASRDAISRGLERAADAITKDTAAALDALLPAWRASVHPRVGDAAEQLAVRVHGSEATYMFGPGPVDEAVYASLRDACKAPPDPRTARAVLKCLAAASPVSKDPMLPRVEDALAALLVHVRDGRFVEAVEQHVERERPSAWRPVRESLRIALTAMKDVRPAVLSASDVERLGVIEDVLAQRPPRPAGSNGPTTYDLFAAVYDDPDDDAPRRALGERLVEAGDPRGEFICLQLDRQGKNSEVTKREKDLLKQHGRRWLGELAAILGDDLVFERGFLVEAATGDGRDPKSEKSPFFAALASGDGVQVEWSTVRRLALWRHAGFGVRSLFRGSRLRGLREVVDVKLSNLPNLLHGAPRPLERLEFASARRPGPNTDGIRDYEEKLPEKLPELTHLRLAAPDGILDGVRGIVERLAKLRELSVGLAAPRLAELAAFAKERGITVRALGRVDVAFIPESATLDVSFPDVLRADEATDVVKLLAAAGDAPIRRVVVKKPAGTEAEASGDAPPVLKRSKESLDLRTIYEASHARGAACSVEDEEPFWARRA